VASFLALTGKKYSEAPLTKEFRGLIGGLADIVTEEAREYSHQLRIPVPVKLRTVAPTGTIAKLPGVSEGIHPIFSRYFIRRVRFNKLGDDAEQVKALKQQGYLVEDDMYAPDTFVVSIPTKDSLLQAVTDLVGDDKAEETVQSVYDLTLTEMLTFQAMYQAVWADNAVSYTANIPQGYDVQVLADTITEFGGALKGMTVFPDVSMPQTPYQQITKEEYEKSQTHDIGDGVDEECCTGACPVR
jgi:ribonucleoside-triphosphate reductase